MTYRVYLDIMNRKDVVEAESAAAACEVARSYARRARNITIEVHGEGRLYNLERLEAAVQDGSLA